jgi:hypothetical protein
LIDFNGLTDEQVASALRLVTKAWIDSGNPAALATASTIANAGEQLSDLPQWLTPGASVPLQQMAPAELAGLRKYSRATLMVLSQSESPEIRRWVHDSAVACATHETLLVEGTILIGIILAARVERIDGNGVSFYRGLPANVVSFITKLASTHS